MPGPLSASASSMSGTAPSSDHIHYPVPSTVDLRLLASTPSILAAFACSYAALIDPTSCSNCAFS
eukprot:3203344-Amphidinium_carterae.1